MNFKDYVSYLIHLIRCTILDIVPDSLPEGMELGKLLSLARKHSIENIAYVALAKLNLPQSDALKMFCEYHSHAILNDATQQYYLEMVTDELEKREIRHCIMKGPVIKKLYPTSDLRQSGDLDIFVDDENTETVKQLMEEMGFAVKDYDRSHSHDEYEIDKKIVIEIHRTLISNQCPWQKECQKIADRLVPVKGYNYRFDMTDEDYYLYMIGHMAKHMNSSGMGIKMVLDVWVYLNHFNNKLNWDMLNESLELCGLKEFEENIKKLCSYWFEDKQADGMIECLAAYVAVSGNFGTYEQLVAGEAARNAGKTSNKAVGRLGYYMSLFFWPYNKMKERYTVLKKYPFLLPFCWIHRAYKSVTNKEKADSIRSRYDDVDMEYGRKLVEFKKEIGL